VWFGVLGVGVGLNDDPSLGVKVGNIDTVGVAIAVGLFEGFLKDGATDGSFELSIILEGYCVTR